MNKKIKSIHYNYITTNLINGKQYIGKHSTNNIDDDYLGSGAMLRRAIKKYGKQNFKREILCMCKSDSEALENEEKYISEYNTIVPHGYNLTLNGGYIGDGILGSSIFQRKLELMETCPQFLNELVDLYNEYVELCFKKNISNKELERLQFLNKLQDFKNERILTIIMIQNEKRKQKT